eukprot:XP_001710053.1 Hypothetical protein GL50803_35047 [Giardia lamblia ATCC 50803]
MRACRRYYSWLILLKYSLRRRSRHGCVRSADHQGVTWSCLY